MKKITSFDRSNLKQIRTSLEAALERVGSQYGITFDLGNMRFLDTHCRVPLEMACIGKSGQPEGKDAVNFRHLCTRYDLKPTDLGRKFTSNGKAFTIVGLNPRRPKYPVVAVTTDGRRFKFPADRVRSLLQ